MLSDHSLFVDLSRLLKDNTVSSGGGEGPAGARAPAVSGQSRKEIASGLQTVSGQQTDSRA